MTNCLAMGRKPVLIVESILHILEAVAHVQIVQKDHGQSISILIIIRVKKTTYCSEGV
jgi:hypothetical protein